MKKAFLFLLVCSPGLAQTITPIGAIQGSGAVAVPGSYTIEAVVTGVYPGLSPAGFYVQDETAAADGNPATSDALFVAQAAPTVAVGDKVRISGTVQENGAAPSYYQATITSPVITVLSSGNALPAFALLSNSTYSTTTAEACEGMRVQFTAPLTVADVRDLKGRGEVTLSTDGLVYHPTQLLDPNDDPASGTSSTGSSNVAAIVAYAAANGSKSITLDDGSAASYPTPIPYLDAATQTLRVGSTAASLRGILGYGFSKFRLQPLAGADAPNLRVVRPPVPTFSAVDVKLASFNVLNYFNGDGLGGGFPTSRGALTLVDFGRQRSKIITALSQMNADVFGLIEIENDGTGPNSAIQDLVNGLNQAVGAGTYALVDDGALRQPNNTDLIHCAIIYKPAAVTPLGGVLIPTVTGIFERPPVAQLFRTNRSTTPADTFALVVNHFKSKGSGSGINADQQDGQGLSNDRRRRQATGLVQFLTGTVVPAGASRIVSVGDYNAYYEEDPMDILRAAGFVVAGTSDNYSYVFDGRSGSLDHAVLSASLQGHAAVEKWHLNASEPEFLEYDFAGAATDVSSPFRSSDHDPVLIGLSFRGSVTGTFLAANATQMHAYPNPTLGAFNFQLTNTPATEQLTLEVVSAQGQRLLRLHGSAAALQQEVARRSALLAPGLYLLHLTGPGLRLSQRVVKQ
jgi:predicted extracellular nuclease